MRGEGPGFSKHHSVNEKGTTARSFALASGGAMADTAVGGCAVARSFTLAARKRKRRQRESGHALLQVLIWIAAVGILWWQRDALLGRIGTALDVSQAPQKADVALVLAGGWQGERVLKAGELVRAGYVPYVLLSGPHDYYEQPECNYAIPYAVAHGLPASYFQCAEVAGGGSKLEVAALLKELERRQVKSCPGGERGYAHAAAAVVVQRDGAGGARSAPGGRAEPRIRAEALAQEPRGAESGAAGVDEGGDVLVRDVGTQSDPPDVLSRVETFPI